MVADSGALAAAEARRQRIAALGFDYLGQPRRVVETCNLCGAGAFTVLTHRDRYGYPAQAHGCRRCGLVFLNPVMTAEAYRYFYTAVYRLLVSAYHGRLISAKTIQAEQRQYAVERAELLAPYLSGGRFHTLLDVGGSTGVVAQYLAQTFNLQATVVDPAPLEIEEARRRGLETITGLVEDVAFHDRRFDAVTVCQTVDHLLDIAGALRTIRTLLKTNGMLFIDIVDLRAAYLRHWSIEESIKIDHPFSLTEPTMMAYLLRAGFETLRVEYAADHLHVGFVCRPGPIEPDYVPPRDAVDRLWCEVRMVQNAPRLV